MHQWPSKYAANLVRKDIDCNLILRGFHFVKLQLYGRYIATPQRHLAAIIAAQEQKIQTLNRLLLSEETSTSRIRACDNSSHRF